MAMTLRRGYAASLAVFGARSEALDMHSTPADTEGWDSIAHI